MRIVGGLPDGKRREGILNLLEQLCLILVKFSHEGILIITLWQDAVTDNGVDRIAKESEVGFGAHGLFDDHTFGIDDGAIELISGLPKTSRSVFTRSLSSLTASSISAEGRN